MSLFKMLLGGDFKSNLKDGLSYFESGMYGDAKLAFERAVKKARREHESDVGAVREKIGVCKDELAKARIVAADNEARDGNLELAMEYLEEARDISDSRDIRELVAQQLKELDSNDARALKEEVDEISDEKLLAIIAGTWTEDQAKEYAAMPDELSAALLARHDEDHGRARDILEELINRANLTILPKYLWFELAESRLHSSDPEGALEAYGRFISLFEGDGAAAELVVLALTQKAGALAALERFDEAKSILVKATKINAGNHGPHLALGTFLRARGQNQAALESLEKASELMGTMQPDFAVIRELGFTHLAMGEKEMSKGYFESVIQNLAATGGHDKYDPETAVALARLHEESGDFGAAADIFRHLAVGEDVANHFQYNLESARLIHRTGKDVDLAKRYWVRAREIARMDREVELVEETGRLLGM